MWGVKGAYWEWRERGSKILHEARWEDKGEVKKSRSDETIQHDYISFSSREELGKHAVKDDTQMP